MTQESSSRFESEILTQPESESDDDLLEEPSPFASEAGQKKKAVALKTVTQDSDQSSAPQSPVADERKALEERAHKIVYTLLSDKSFNTPTPENLFWHSFQSSKKDAVFLPCQIRPVQEAANLILSKTKQVKDIDTSKQALVKYLAHHATELCVDYTLVSVKQLRPYNHGQEEDTDTWSTEFLDRYTTLILQKKLHTELDILVEQLYLKRVLEEAQQKQQAAAESKRGEASATSRALRWDSSIMDNSHKKSAAQHHDSDESDEDDVFESSKKEKLRAGDIIEYTPVHFVAGRTTKRATILSVDRSRSNYIVVNTGDPLPNDHRIRLVERMLRGKRVKHEGSWTQIQDYSLVKSDTGDASLSAGHRAEAKRVGEILDRNLAKMQKEVAESGMGPTDIFHHFGGRSAPPESAATDQSTAAAPDPKPLQNEEKRRKVTDDNDDEQERPKKRSKTSVAETTKTFCRSRRRPPRISQRDGETAVKWHNAIAAKYGTSGKEYDEGVRAVAARVGTTENLLSKLLAGDPQKLVAEHVLAETAQKLRDSEDALLDNL